MNPKFLSDEELIAAFDDAKKTATAGGGRITSWTSNGTSVAKQYSGLSPNELFNRLAREICHRIAEGRIEQELFPHLSPLARPARAQLYPKGI